MLGIFLDLETTGLNPFKHRTIEIALKIIDVNTGSLVGSFDSVIRQPRTIWEESDPESLAVNGFTWELVATGKSEEEVADSITKLFTAVGIKRNNSVYICQNPAFDRSFFSQFLEVYEQERHGWPYHWLDLASMYWGVTMRSYKREGKAPPTEMIISKNAIARQYNQPEESRPHRAMNGVDHLILCYHAVLNS